MPNLTPLQTVKKEFESKEALVARVASLVEADSGESADDHRRRLRNVANRKLLHLLALGKKVEELGGREAIVKAILEAKGQPKDHEYGDHLKALPLGRLLDVHASAKRRAAGKAAKKPKSQRPKRG